MKAVDLADTFAAVFGEPVGTGATTYRVELTAPEGFSTGGGKQAVQHIKLVPVAPNGPTLVIGAVNQVEATAEIRTFDYLAQVHAQRFKGARIPLEKTHYLVLQRNMMGFFSDNGLTVTPVDAPRMTPIPSPAVVSKRPPRVHPDAWIYLALGLAVGIFCAGILFYLVMRSRGH